MLIEWQNIILGAGVGGGGCCAPLPARREGPWRRRGGLPD